MASGRRTKSIIKELEHEDSRQIYDHCLIADEITRIYTLLYGKTVTGRS